MYFTLSKILLPWAWRRMRVSWTERRSNTWVRQTVGVPEDQGLLAQLKKRKLAMYGHWKRWPEHCFSYCGSGREGKPGCRRTAWIDNIRAWTNGGLGAARENARRRMRTVLWRTMAYSSSKMRCQIRWSFFIKQPLKRKKWIDQVYMRPATT